MPVFLSFKSVLLGPVGTRRCVASGTFAHRNSIPVLITPEESNPLSEAQLREKPAAMRHECDPQAYNMATRGQVTGYGQLAEQDREDERDSSQSWLGGTDRAASTDHPRSCAEFFSERNQPECPMPSTNVRLALLVRQRLHRRIGVWNQ